MAITKLQLYNGALRLCGERKVTLTEEREPRRILDDIYDEDVIKRCLEQGQWQFATRTVKLEASTSVSPDFGYAYAFEKPSDWVRTTMLASDEYFHNVLTQMSMEAGYIFSDLDILYLAYVSDDASYGGDLSLWPLSFSKYVMAEMAYEAAPRLTGVKVDMEKLERLRDKRLVDAQNTDGVNRPTRFPSRGSWNNSRHGRYTRFTDRRR
jgi:hypothetical protein